MDQKMSLKDGMYKKTLIRKAKLKVVCFDHATLYNGTVTPLL